MSFSRFWTKTVRAARAWGVGRLFAALVALEAACVLAETLLGRSIPLHRFVHFAFFVLGVWAASKALRWVANRVLWRVRHRLLVTYFLVGVVPLVLLATMVALTAAVLMGQLAGYLFEENLNRRLALLDEAAYEVAVNSAAGPNLRLAAEDAAGNVRLRFSDLEVALHRGDESLVVIPADSPSPLSDRLPVPLPAPWMRSGFSGVLDVGDDVGDVDPRLVLTAYSAFGDVEVTATQPLEPEVLGSLMRALGTVRVVGSPDAIPVADRPENAGSPDRNLESSPFAADSSQALALPEPEAFWDVPIPWPLPFEIHAAANGETRDAVAIVTSRPSLIVARIFSTVQFGGSIGTALLIVGGIFLVVEALSLVLIVKLTRSITRTVAQTYEATREVEAGNLSHRIPIHSNDQLTALAHSFNSMTGQIEHLIAEVKEKERFEHELNIARDVQARLFPEAVPVFGDLETTGVCEPARTVSGDYYDFVRLNERYMALVIGDIAGKGISAALLMASLQSSIRALLGTIRPKAEAPPSAVDPALSTSRIVGQLNRQLHATTDADKFSTMFFGIYDRESKTLRYTNAGHPPPMVIRREQSQALEITGGLVGAFPDLEFGEQTVTLAEGDVLIATTDGVTEREDAGQTPFGERRLGEVALAHRSEPLASLLAAIIDAARNWGPDQPEPDDTTILIARRMPFGA